MYIGTHTSDWLHQWWGGSHNLSYQIISPDKDYLLHHTLIRLLDLLLGLFVHYLAKSSVSSSPAKIIEPQSYILPI
jgi:hypothetical protein